MVTSTKGNFRINLKVYAQLSPSHRRTSRKTAPVQSYRDSNQSSNWGQITRSQISSIVDQQRLQNIRKVCKKTLLYYQRNLQFYRLNEQKLLRTIESQIKQRNYIYQNLILNFIRTHEQIPIRSSINLIKLQKQLQLLNKFLQDLYEKKRIKEISIVCENLKEQDNIIADKVNYDQFQVMHQKINIIQPMFVNDFISEYQNICLKFGTAQPYLNSHILIRNQLETTRKEYKNFYEKKKSTISKFSHLHRKK